ncbi:DHA2 family efflux MFS transporter permease subunit [Govanella unica]|uniref:DHA2 family efflux MFS transporter permease subunit n=1 Tax=Govanella unica TaxID=2975056 RepID=A0A9X3Z7D3_9PROT|nr:DHA2 family efflux MFS transporter permease subunit [Govania unica]MDA5194056.1 DHA2 family efflux MFS transporter permease subunit [Govania unica]
MSSPAATESAVPDVPYRGMITLVIMAATVMQVLDSTIANIALPHMQGALGAAQDTITWVLTSYIVASAVVVPMTGWLTNRLGRKGLMLISVGGFTIASMLCGIASGLGEMVLYRILQGICGACIVPLGQTIMLDINPPDRQGRAMALWGAGVMVGPIMGPTLGGWITEAYNWRWVFYINLPIGILTFLGVLTFMPNSRGERSSLNFPGFAMLAIAVGAFQLMLDRGEHLDWFASTEVLIEAAVAAGCFWMFVNHVLFAKSPFLSPEIFRDRNYSVSLLFTFVSGVMMLAAAVLLPPLLQSLMGYPTMTAGLVMAPRGIGTMLIMLLLGRILDRVDVRWGVLGSALLISWSLYDMTKFSLGMDEWPVVFSGFIQGLGIGMLFLCMTKLAFATLPAQYRAEATGLYSLVRNLGTSVGVTLVSTMLAQNIQRNHAMLGEHISPFAYNFDPSWAQFLSVSGGASVIAMVNAEITRQATLIAILDDFKLLMYVTLATIPFILFLRRPPRVAAGQKAEDHVALD